MQTHCVRYLQEINAHNQQTALLTEMWANYTRNTAYNLESQGELKRPI